jgi:hypothetical protein
VSPILLLTTSQLALRKKKKHIRGCIGKSSPITKKSNRFFYNNIYAVHCSGNVFTLSGINIFLGTHVHGTIAVSPLYDSLILIYFPLKLTPKNCMRKPCLMAMEPRRILHPCMEQV